ncbi:companion of cellulose synthase 1 [Hibiscus trionum]|uniref:Companion of cellulose synthase 1 n=1 Tax=Hibiscus trionum TaxID=183268 RepID=A0A9W7HLF6_HIBTR|nr:companion of cellulose synthase 1 [Hibiscus trionum]
MLSTKSESDITSLAPSSPSRSPKRPVYYVQSPSRDSHDGDKSSTMQPSPMESPSHPSSVGRHSRNSSASRFSGIFRSSSGRKGGRKRNDKGWPECGVIMEEGSYDEFEDKAFTRRFQALMALLTFVVLFTVFCLIIWGASRPYKAEIVVKSFAVHNVFVGEGSDFSGVPTRMLTINGTMKMSVYNPASTFGIHVSSNPVNLAYSEINVATGQLKYYQPRKSRRTVSVVLEGEKVPLYGAGSSLTFTQNGAAQVPLILRFEVRSRGNVVGKLVRTRHRKHISCPLVINSVKTKLIKFNENECTYD